MPALPPPDLDIRDRQAIRALFREQRPDFIIHTAAQPSHDKAASIPYDDFDVNAVGTLNLLVAARDYLPGIALLLHQHEQGLRRPPRTTCRWSNSKSATTTPTDSTASTRSMSIDQCLHSLFGASKVAADVMCQEFGRYFQMPVGVFRGGCLTGPQHAAVELHGYLAYIVHLRRDRQAIHRSTATRASRCATRSTRRDVAACSWSSSAPRVAARSTTWAAGAQQPLHPGDDRRAGGHGLPACNIATVEQNRIGDHICYISDLTKARTQFPRLEAGVRR